VVQDQRIGAHTQAAAIYRDLGDRHAKARR
jgi:hypothetical protein